MKKIYLFIITLTIFSFWIYFFKNYFLWTFESNLNNYVENNYIEPSDRLNYEKITNELNSGSENETKQEKINFLYIPWSFSTLINDYENSYKSFLDSELVINKIDVLIVELYKEKKDVRWKMKNRRVKLYWVRDMLLSEFNAVWIHEFAHFIDLYYLKKSLIVDVSDYYYKISWDGVTVIKPWLTWEDFVSGYAMTNKYEDFAETYTYYVLHNRDFLERAKKSQILKKKYDFINKYLFRDYSMRGTNFSVSWDQIQSYYRDITKIDFSLQNFLEFLKK